MHSGSALKVWGGGWWWVCKPTLVFICRPLVELNNNAKFSGHYVRQRTQRSYARTLLGPTEYKHLYYKLEYNQTYHKLE